jgi:hypothetical protein
MVAFILTTAFAAAACSSDGIDSDEQARRAYLGLDQSIGKALTLGFKGFNEASSANISPQMTTGTSTGMLTITGQVDQGASTNKEMRLYVGMVNYSDGQTKINDNGDTITVTYDTSTDMTMQPYLSLSLRNIPDGTFTGTLTNGTLMTGIFHMTGDLKGDVILNLTMSGQLQSNGSGGTDRKPGSTTVTGTATSGDGTYDVNVTI